MNKPVLRFLYTTVKELNSYEQKRRNHIRNFGTCLGKRNAWSFHVADRR